MGPWGPLTLLEPEVCTSPRSPQPAAVTAAPAAPEARLLPAIASSPVRLSGLGKAKAALTRSPPPPPGLLSERSSGPWQVQGRVWLRTAWF